MPGCGSVLGAWVAKGMIEAHEQSEIWHILQIHGSRDEGGSRVLLLSHGAGMEEQGMSLRKRARSLRRADSASELPLLREAMAAPEGASKPAQESEDEGV